MFTNYGSLIDYIFILHGVYNANKEVVEDEQWNGFSIHEVPLAFVAIMVECCGWQYLSWSNYWPPLTF